MLVTGGAGFIGSHVVESLLRRGDVVVGVDNFDPFYSPDEKRRNLRDATQHPRFRFVEADIADGPALRRALGDVEVDAVVHLAARAGVRPSIRDPAAYVRTNVLGTQNVLELARERGVRRVVFGSSSSVYGNDAPVPFAEDDPVARPISPYAATKRAGELLCHAYHHLHGMSVLALRYFTVYGPRQRPDLAIRMFATRMLRGEPIPVFGDGGSERDYTWIDDIVTATLAALDRMARVPAEFEIVNVGGSRTTSLSRLVALLAEALGVEPTVERLPVQPGDVVRTHADVSKAERLLGYRPTMAVEEGVRRFVAWLRERHTLEAGR